MKRIYKKILLFSLLLCTFFSTLFVLTPNVKADWTGELPTNLTGYTVQVPIGWVASSGYGIFDIDFYDAFVDEENEYIDNSILFDGLYIGYFDSDGLGNFTPTTDRITYARNGFPEYSLHPNLDIAIFIQGGTDTTNQSLIQWFYNQGASFLPPTPDEPETSVDDEKSKLKSLEGATITWTDRLTNEKISDFVNNNLDLFVKNSNNDYFLYFDFYNKTIGNCNSIVFLSYHDGKDYELSLGDFDSGRLFWDYINGYDYFQDFVCYNLQPNENTPDGLLENRAFIDFIFDTCDVEGGIYVKDSEKRVSLQGATITWTDRLTNEKISDFVNNNLDLFEFLNSHYYLFFNHSTYNVGDDCIYEENDLIFYKDSENDWDVFSSNCSVFNNGSLDEDITFTKLQPNENTLTGLLENQAFINFIQDVCDVEGGVWEETNINPLVTVNQDDSSSIDITSSSDIYYMINNTGYWVPVITSETSFPYTIDDVSSIQFKNDDSSLILSISYNDEVVNINPGESTTINITEDLEVILSLEQINKVYFTNTSDVNFINNGYDFYYQINESGSWVPIVSSVSPLPYTLDNVESIKFKNNSNVYNLVFVSAVLDIPDLSPKSESELFIIPDTDDHITTFTFYLSIPEHEHVFVNGSCECGTIDETYTPPHEHIYINGECECGELDPNTNTGDTGDTDVKTLIIRTDNPNMSDYTNLFYYRTNLMTNYENLEVTTSSAKCITDLDTIQFKNLNKNVVMVLRYNNEVINLAYGEESEILDTSDIYLMNLQVSFDLDNDDPLNPGVGEENPDDDKDDDLGKWAEEQPLIVIVIGVAVIAVVVVLVLKKRW